MADLEWNSRVVFLVAGVSAGVALFARRRRRRRQLQLRSCTAGPPRLEVCADSVAAAVAAEEGGADRVELCDSLLEGGTTPSVGKLLCCRRAVSLPVHVMLRPRGGDFLYSPAEIDVIEADLHALKAAGADGVVVGLLRADGRVDEASRRASMRLEPATHVSSLQQQRVWHPPYSRTCKLRAPRSTP